MVRPTNTPRPRFSWKGDWKEELSASLDGFDRIQTHQEDGQQWYPAGDLILLDGKVERLRLLGVSRHEVFRQTLLKARNSYVGVKRSMQAEA